MRRPHIETMWAAQAALDRDVVNVFVVRYHWPADDGRQPLRSEHLRTDGRWHEHGPGDVMQPALTIPGFLIHELPKARQFYPTLEEQQVMSLIERVMANA